MPAQGTGQYANIRVLVTDASNHNTLAIVRSLGKRGFKVDCAMAYTKRWRQGFPFATVSKYCGRRHFYRDPRISCEAFIEDLVSIVSAGNYDVLLPVGASTALPVSAYREQLAPHVHIPFPDFETVSRAYDKAETWQAAQEIGVPTPITYLPTSLEDARILASTIEYPVVLKARKGSSAWGVSYAANADEVLKTYESAMAWTAAPSRETLAFDWSSPMMQEYIPGATYDVCLIADRGKVLTALTQERLKTLPVSGGGGIVNITNDLPELRDLAVRLAEHLGWHGVAQVEFRRDVRDGVFKLIEFNPKFWGTIALAISAGIDFPFYACQLALGEKIEPARNYVIGRVYRWTFPQEIAALFESERRWTYLKNMLSIRGKDVQTDFDVHDLRPFFAQLCRTACIIAGRLAGRTRTHSLDT